MGHPLKRAFFAAAMLPCLLMLQALAFARGGKHHDADVQEKHRTLNSFADVDQRTPPIAAGVTCPALQVMSSASERVKELVSIFPQITATERVEHFEWAGHDRWHAPHVASFNYVAELQEIRPGMLHMQEMRNGSTSPNVLPGPLADFGLPAIALIFHPYFMEEYDMFCEGLGEWKGKPAWQVHFQQRLDKPARLRVYRAGMRSFPVKLKGRAWFATDDGHVLHVETDLLQPIPELRLYREHLAIDYGPVRFKKSDEDFWLPSTADVFLNIHGRMYHRRHLFSDFLLFSVDVEQKIAADPK